MCWRCCCMMALRLAPTWALRQIYESICRTAWPMSNINNFQTYLSFTLQQTGDSKPTCYEFCQVQSPLTLSPPKPHTILFVEAKEGDQCDFLGKKCATPYTCGSPPCKTPKQTWHSRQLVQGSQRTEGNFLPKLRFPFPHQAAARTHQSASFCCIAARQLSACTSLAPTASSMTASSEPVPKGSCRRKASTSCCTADGAAAPPAHHTASAKF